MKRNIYIYIYIFSYFSSTVALRKNRIWPNFKTYAKRIKRDEVILRQLSKQSRAVRRLSGHDDRAGVAGAVELE